MDGVPLTIILGLAFGAAAGMLTGYPVLGVGAGITLALVLAAIVDVLTSHTRHEA